MWWICIRVSLIHWVYNMRQFYRQGYSACATGKAIHSTSGNVLTPVEFGRSIHGNFRKPGSSQKLKVSLDLFAAMAVGLIVYNKVKRT